MEYLIYLLFVLIILFLIIDLIIYYYPKSELEIMPIKYKINSREIKFEFKIKNKSIKKETMVPNMDIEIDYLDNQNLINTNFTKEILIDDGNLINNYKNNWKTTIIKSNSFIKVFIKMKLKDKSLEEKSIWLKLNWTNYGHFGLINKQDCFLLNNISEITKTRKLIKMKRNNNYELIAIKTNLFGIFEEPIKTVTSYCKDIVKGGDILVIGETPLAIMQGRYINPLNVSYTPFAKFLCYFFHPTSSLATACGMQLLINKIGVTRIIFSLVIGLIFKSLGIKGLFYILSGKESSLIDDISGTTFPYDKSIVMGPIETKIFCKDLSMILGIDIAVADVNDLGKVKILATSNNSTLKILEENLKTNPAGNGDQKTPIVIIRKI